MTTGLWEATMSEQRGNVSPPADIDKYAVVFCCTSAGTNGLNGPYATARSMVTGVGYGDGVDLAGQMAEQRQTNGSSVPAVPVGIFKLPVTTAGSYGTIDNSAVTGTCLPAVNTNAPYGTYRIAARIVTGGALGVDGIVYETASDDVPTYGNARRLGSTGYTIDVPGTNSGFDLGPPSAQVTAFIASAVEMRADTLAHLADVTAHDGADTSAAQVLLAASSVPTTGATAWAVMNLCRNALASHDTNITAHNGPDPVNTVSHAAATSVQTGIDLAVEYKVDYNAHLGIALANSAAGLKAATATLLTTAQVFTSADLLDAGEALLATYPRRLVFTTAAGSGSASDAPSTATIVGTDYADAAQTETGLALAQTATTATSTKAFKTITSITYAADGGTGATIAIGYGQGVHNSADVTNTISATDATHGTLVAGDEIVVRTIAPQPSAADIDAAFVTMSKSGKLFGIVVCEFNMTQAMIAHLTTGLNVCKATNRLMWCAARTRVRDIEGAESETTWSTAMQSAYPVGTTDDSRVVLFSSYARETDARTTNVYLRAGFAQFCADMLRVPINAPPACPADQSATGLSLWDSSDVQVGHDEGPRGDVTGLSNADLGNRFVSTVSAADPVLGNAVFFTVPWTLAAADDDIKTMMMRRVATSMERVAVSAATGEGGALLDYTAPDENVPGDVYRLTAVSRGMLHSVIYNALSERYAGLIQNADDADPETGLVYINPVITVSAAKLVGVTYELKTRFRGVLVSINGTFVVQE